MSKQVKRGTRDAYEKTTQQSFENITGGNSFIVLTRSWGSSVDSSPGALPMWTAFIKGDSGVHSASVEIVDMEQMNGFERQHPDGFSFSDLQRMQTVYSFGEMSAGYGRIVFLPLLPQKTSARLSMNFFAMNGVWHELYVCREINGNVESATRVTREIGTRVKKTIDIYEYVTPKFPKDKRGHPLWTDETPLW